MYNGVRASDIPGVEWRKSSRSGAGNCVELAELTTRGPVAVRNSRFPDGPALVYTRAEIEALLLGVKDGDFDDLLSCPTTPGPRGGSEPPAPAPPRVSMSGRLH